MPKNGMGSFEKLPSLQNFADFLMKFPEIQTPEQMRLGQGNLGLIISQKSFGTTHIYRFLSTPPADSDLTGFSAAENKVGCVHNTWRIWICKTVGISKLSIIVEIDKVLLALFCPSWARI